jgi:hypothetical protein
LTKLLERDHPALRRSAADALSRVGYRDSTAAPNLNRLLAANYAPELRRSAADALVKLGRSASLAVPALSLGLSTATEEPIQLSFAFALGQIGQATPEAGAALVTGSNPDDAGGGDSVGDSKTVKPASVAGHSGLIELIRGLPRSYLDEPHAPSTHLVESLLRSRRMLVIVDRYSDMSTSIKRWLNLFAADSPVNALIVTASSSHPESRK